MDTENNTAATPLYLRTTFPNLDYTNLSPFEWHCLYGESMSTEQHIQYIDKCAKARRDAEFLARGQLPRKEAR